MKTCLLILLLFLNFHPYHLEAWYIAPKGLITVEEHLKVHPEDGSILQEAYVCNFKQHPLLQNFSPNQFFPELFLLNIVGGRTFGNSGYVLTQDNLLLRELALDTVIPAEYNILLRKKVLYDPKFYDAEVASVASASSACYYHWMFDVIPKIGLLEKSGIKPDYYYISYTGLPYQKESLELLGINMDKLIISSDNAHIQARNLIVPSLSGECHGKPEWVFDYLKEKFLIDKTPTGYERIYISRKLAKTRRVANESQIEEMLKKYRFKVVLLEKMTLTEQARLFHSAKLIVGPHGAGFTNVAFSNPGTELIEMFAPDYIDPGYWAVTEQLGINHICFLGRSCPVGRDTHMTIDVAELENEIIKAIERIDHFNPTTE